MPLLQRPGRLLLYCRRLHRSIGRDHVPIYEQLVIWGVGPRVEEPGINLVRSYAYSAPYEDLRLKRP